MNTPLQNTSVTGDELELAEPITEEQEEEHAEGEEGHIHLPGPSYWPVILGVALLITIGGFLFINSSPWITIIGIPLVFIGIMGWALEDPMASKTPRTKPGEYATSFAEAAITGKPTALGQIALREAEDVVDRTVTVSSTAWSAPPVK